MKRHSGQVPDKDLEQYDRLLQARDLLFQAMFEDPDNDSISEALRDSLDVEYLLLHYRSVLESAGAGHLLPPQS